MNANNFDRFTRAVFLTSSRRALFGLAAGMFALIRGHASAAQLGPATCGASGAVCTMLAGCCDGLTCVTSSINTNYGVCVPGDGGTVAAGTSLISPFSEGVVEEIGAAATETTTSTTTTDLEAEREQRIAATKARKDTKQNKVQLRRTEQRTRREDQNEKRDLVKGPRLEFDLSIPSYTADPKEPEVVQVRNDTKDTVFISSIHRLSNARIDNTSSRTLSRGQSYFFLSGLPNGATVDSNENAWVDQYVCKDDPTDGFVIEAGISATVPRFREFTILCDGTVLIESRRKRKKGNQNSSGNGRGNASRRKNKKR